MIWKAKRDLKKVKYLWLIEKGVPKETAQQLSKYSWEQILRAAEYVKRG